MRLPLVTSSLTVVAILRERPTVVIGPSLVGACNAIAPRARGR
jgi:hypothetical protein